MDGKVIKNDIGEIIPSVRYALTVDDLRHQLYRWYRIEYRIWPPEIYEANYFCRILRNDGILTTPHSNDYGNWSMNSFNLEQAREACYSQKYKETGWITAIHVSTILNAAAATALVVLTYLSDRNTEIYQEQSRELQRQSERIEQLERNLELSRDSTAMWRKGYDSLSRPSPPAK